MINSFIKGGLVTRIDIIKGENNLKAYFNLDLYNKKKNSYFLKEKELNRSILAFRRQLLKLTNNQGDSIEDSDSYVLLTNSNELLKGSILFENNNKEYYYSKYKNNKFETLIVYEKLDKTEIRLYIMPIIWDISLINIEDDLFLKTLLNNMIRKSLKDKLKDTFWFTICN